MIEIGPNLKEVLIGAGTFIVVIFYLWFFFR